MTRTPDHHPANPSAVPARLIEDAKEGSRAAFDALYRTFDPLLQRYLTAVSPDLAADVCAATWESAARSIGRFSGDGDQFRRWIFTIARRRLVDEVRRSTRRPLALAEVPEVAHIDPHDELVGADWAVAVLSRIPTRQADVVALRVIGGLSVAEVGTLLGITHENVRVLSHRGLNAIKRILESDSAEVRPSESSGEAAVEQEEILSVV